MSHFDLSSAIDGAFADNKGGRSYIMLDPIEKIVGSQSPAVKTDYEVLVIGSGFAGIGMGIKLKKIGIHNFAILEKASDLGGVWRDNTYPGLTVDIPALTYSFSFEQNPSWSSMYPPRAELKQYADHCAEKYGVRSHIQFNKTVSKSVYDEGCNLWITHLDNGESITSRYLVSASGFLSTVQMPNIKGINDFKGKVMHTARWDNHYDLTGKRVGFIGTGATAIQLIPEIAPQVKSLVVYQRTAIWNLPKLDGPISEGVKKAFRYIPLFQRLSRFITVTIVDFAFMKIFMRYQGSERLRKWIERKCREYICAQVKDPATQEKLTPKFDYGCKRPGFSNKYYATFNRENVELVTTPIARITEKGIVTTDGQEREIDTLICATGYHSFKKGAMPTFGVYGKNGIDIGDFWEENRYSAFMGATVPNYPNYFLIFGPYSLSNSSYFGMIENQTLHVARCLKAAQRRNANYIEVKKESHDQDFQEVQRQAKKTIFALGNCAESNSYYYDRHGDAPAVRPILGIETWWKTRLFSMDHYNFSAK